MTLSTTGNVRRRRGRTALAAVVVVARVAVVGLLASYTGLLLFAVAPVAFGMTSTVVLTGSMRPGIQPGDVVLSSAVRPEMLRRGQVLLVRNPAHPGTYLMHRYERVGEGGTIITKGDANRVEDSTRVAVRDVRGLPRLRIPLVGMPVVWLRFGVPPAVKYAGAAFAAAAVLALVRRPKRSLPLQKVGEAALPVDVLSSF